MAMRAIHLEGTRGQLPSQEISTCHFYNFSKCGFAFEYHNIMHLRHIVTPLSSRSNILCMATHTY